MACMKRSDEETRKKWAETIAEWRSSGISAAKFARGHGCSEARLYYWASRLAEGSSSEKSVHLHGTKGGTPNLVRVVTRPAVAKAAEVVVEVGHARIRAGRDFDAALLGAVVRALGGSGQ